MHIYQSAKRLVPLEWKIGFYKHKSLPTELAIRVRNRIERHPPLPPRRMIYLVAGHYDPRRFLDGGRSASEAIRKTLQKHGVELEKCARVLDFGCGVGRIIRHWTNELQSVTDGTDYNPDLVAWCRSNLNFSRFNHNGLSGHLPFGDATFDVIYSFSVFTHLQEQLQIHWIDELTRVMKPGGHLYLTTHGEYYVSPLTATEQTQFQRGQLVVREGERSGSNLCVAFHPPGYVRHVLARNLITIDFITCGAQGDSMHDVHLLRKPCYPLVEENEAVWVRKKSLFSSH